MIKILSKRGEGGGLLANLAIEKLLETNPNCICLLVDDTSEFFPLMSKLKGVDVHIAPGYMSLDSYQKFISEKIYENNFFRISYPCYEYKLEDIENSLEGFADKLKVYGRRIYIIYKSAE